MAERGQLPDPADYGPILTPGDVAEILGVHIDTVRRYIREGHIPGHRMGSGERGNVYVLKDELLETLRNRPLVSEERRPGD